MEEKILNELYEISYETKDRFVTPIIMKYYYLKRMGVKSERGIVNLIKNMQNPYLS